MAEANDSDQIKQLRRKLKEKTKELAKVAKQLDDRSRLISSLRQELNKIQKKPDTLSWRIKEIHRILDKAELVSGETFELQMDELNQALYKTLMDRFPELTNHDLRLCAYIKTGLDSKEIAEMMEIKPSSIYITRSRLRKKLNLDPEEDLYGFLNMFSE